MASGSLSITTPDAISFGTASIGATSVSGSLGTASTTKSHKTFPLIPVIGGIGLFLITVIGALLIVRHRRTPSPRHA